MIKYQSTKQISIESFIQPFGGQLDSKNRWVILAKLLPWDELVKVYAKSMSRNMGRKAINPRIAVGALIIKHLLRSTDEDTIDYIKENPYLQYFLGYDVYSYEQPFTSSLFVSLRQRLGMEEFEKISGYFMSRVDQIEKKIAEQKHKEQSNKTAPNNPDKGSGPTEKPLEDEKKAPPTEHKGHLIVDATVAPADIKYPTDLDLLNEARQISEDLIDHLYIPDPGKVKPRTYRQKARAAYLSVAKQRKKQKRTIRQALKSQLNYLGRNLKTIGRLLDERESPCFPLSHKHQKRYWVIGEVYRQQKKMYEERSHKTADRIVSISQPHVRPIVRGKAGKEVEFGAKLSASLVDGYSFVDRISWDAYNEGGDLISQIESFKVRFGHYPEWVSADTIYGTRENRAYMKDHGIKYSGVALGRRPPEIREQEKERKKKSRERSGVEGAFGVGKRRYDLDLVKAKKKSTSESWIGMVYFVMNIARWLRVIFCQFLKDVILNWEKLKRAVFSSIYLNKSRMTSFGFGTF